MLSRSYKPRLALDDPPDDVVAQAAVRSDAAARAQAQRTKATSVDVPNWRVMLRRYLTTIAFVTLAVVLLSAVALAVIPSIYRATAVVLVDPRQQRVTQSESVLS